MHRSGPRLGEADSAQRGRTTRVPDFRVVRVLAVDDDPQARQLIEMALSSAPFELVLEVVGTVGEGLRRISADDHDIYLVDQLLPDGTGISLIHTAKEAGASKPFILITGHGSGDLDAAALREGAADYVEKHLVATHLERSIRYSLRNWYAGRVLLEREEQLRQAQKMEAIGRLAGGVAHDFNNLLTAIIGYTDLVREKLAPEDPVAHDVGEIRKAADRAAALTRQLLAFSRKQFLSPEVLDLNSIVSGMLPMLPRVIGEHIETTTSLAPDLRRVKADPSQMEQVLVNLVLNARDAMPMGGHLAIETSNVELDEERIASERLNLDAGAYVMLGVRDTGSGMDAETRDRVFEPFFTTKAKGKGTGFGLPTVYGIVDQSGGAISLDTAPGRGTSIRIYLPVTSSEEEPARPEVSPPKLNDTGTETLLLVEDNDAVRELAVHALRKRGYTVHEARNAEEAIEWSLNSRIKPHLLVTDVVMPGLSGPNLAARLLQENPRLKVLYMSGYTDDATAVHGAFWGGIPLLQKPFTPGQLAERVRMALDASAGGT
jgi:two-component system, cell cycle sensor histidine kinase and response regulator CckA